jgi:hypothetical protein
MFADVSVGACVWGCGGEEADWERGAAGYGDGGVGGGEEEYVGC